MPFKSNRKIRKLASQIKSTALSRSEAARDIHKAIRQRVKYKTARILPHIYKTARQTHRKRKGNCLDQAVLYSTIAQELGLRTRIIRTDTHAFTVVETENGDLIYDTTHHSLPKKYKHFDNYEEVTQDQIKGLRNSQRTLRRGLAIAKSIALSIAISVTLNLTQPYWQPPLKKIIPETYERIEQIYEETKQTLEDLLD